MGAPIRKRSNRLVRRLSLTFAGVVALSSLLLGSVGFFFELQALNDGFNQKLIAVASVAALRMDADAFVQIKAESDAQKPAYKAMSAELNRIMSDQGLAFAYTVILNDEKNPQLVVDGSEEPEAVGTPYVHAPELVQMYETGFPTVTAITNDADYGRLKTAYAPIRDRSGTIVGAVAMDLAAEVIAQKTLLAAAWYLGIWVLIVLAGIAFGIRAARSIAARVVPLSDAAQALADGDLGVAMAVRRAGRKPDEVDELGQSLGIMQANLRQLVADLKSSAGQVVGASSQLVSAVSTVSALSREADQAMAQVAAGTNDQAQNASEVASFFAQFSQGLNGLTETASRQAALVAQAAEEAAEIARVTEQVVATAGQAASVAAETTEAARAGTAAVGETAAAVHQIAGAVTEASVGMERLSGEAQHIGEISNTIRELAEQSNLLALNAAIEAARAGDHGRGFAVVADEVRKLAGRSAQSADQITEILNAIRNDVGATLVQMRTGLETLSAGSEKAERAREALAVIERSAQRTRQQIEQVVSDSSRNAQRAREIGEKARTAAQQVMESTAAATEAAAGSHRAEGAVQSVAAISEETAALAGNTQRLMNEVAETTAGVQRSVESLVTVSEELKQAIARFRA